MRLRSRARGCSAIAQHSRSKRSRAGIATCTDSAPRRRWLVRGTTSKVAHQRNHLDLQLGPRRLSGGPARGHPLPVPSHQTPIGSLHLTGSASRRAMPLGSWMSRQSRVGPMNSKV